VKNLTSLGEMPLRQAGRSMERDDEDGITVRASADDVSQESSTIPEMCLSLFHATVHKPSDSSTKRDKTRGAHERLAITRR
jgi:hypothetical protein